MKDPSGLNPESERKEKLPYPKSIAFIISNEFCERFSYYGMRTILVLYFKSRLGYTDNSATQAFHIFAMACYFTPVLGAIIADSLLGKFLTILIISAVYAAGNILLSIASVGASVALTFIGLGLIALGTGGIKPCVSAFGGDQFLPGQEKQLQQFFSLFYIAINSGSLISTFVTPIFRQDVECFDRNDCYPLAFGVPAVLMCVALGLFVLGDFLTKYRKTAPEKENIVIIVCKCVWHALARKLCSRAPKREHWLDNADDRFERKTINEVKILMSILFLYIPLPVFWALFDQQGSRWTLQAVRMNGQLGSFIIKPDQIQVVNPLLVIGCIPIFEYIIYPTFNRMRIINTPLKRMTVGGILAALSFAICGIYQLGIESEQPAKLMTNHSHVFFVNGLNCSIDFEFLNNHNSSLEPLNYQQFPNQEKQQFFGQNFKQKLRVTGSGNDCREGEYEAGLTFAKPSGRSGGHEEESEEGDSYIFFITSKIYDQTINVVPSKNILAKPKEGGATVFAVFMLRNYANYSFSISPSNDNAKTSTVDKVGEHTIGYATNVEAEIKGPDVRIGIDSKNESRSFLQLDQGAVYILLVTGDCNDKQLDTIAMQVVDKNQLSVFLQLIQYFVITAGEIMFSITGLEFSYSQAPKSMKSVLQACWLLTVAFGNLIVAILADLKIFEEQSYEFFFYAALMLLDMVVFAIMAYFYKPCELPTEDSDAHSDNIALEDVNKSNHGFDKSHEKDNGNHVDHTD